MKVKELIEKLMFPQGDFDVVIAHPDSGVEIKLSNVSINLDDKTVILDVDNS